MLAVCFTVVLIVPLAVQGPAYLVPAWTWWAAAVGYLSVTVWVMVQPSGARRTVAGVAAQTALAGVLIIGIPGAGWLPILLVFGAALSTYLVSWRATAVVIVVNTAVLVVGLVLGARLRDSEVPVVEIVLSAGLYLLLQVASALVSAVLQREQRLRTELSVAHQQHRGAVVAQAADEVEHAAPGLGVEAGGELVEDHHPRVADQCHGDRGALHLPAGEVGEPGTAAAGQAHGLDELVGFAARRVEGAVQPHELEHRQGVVQAGLLELDAQDATDLGAVGPGVVVQHPDRAGVGGAQAADEVDRRGLAGPVAAQQPDDLADLDMEADVVQRHGGPPPTAELLAQVPRSYRCHGLDARDAGHRRSRATGHDLGP